MYAEFRSLPPRRRLMLERLENRILFDGVSEQPVPFEPEFEVEQSVDVDANNAAANDAPSVAFAQPNELSGESPPLESQSVSLELVFVDPGFQDSAELQQWIRPGMEVHVLDATRDGVEQIAEILDGRTGLKAIHIVSHGSEGSLTLGSAVLNGGTMQTQYGDELTVIGQALSHNGDLLIWGCDFGRGAIGAQTSQLLSEMTNADVAASVNLTGHRDLNADWNLELKIGSIEAGQIVTVEGQQQWRGVLSNIVTPFTSRYSSNEYGDITMASNLLLWSGSVANNSGDGINNSFAMVHYDGDSDSTTFNSSTADLVLPSESTVLFAGLYWMAESSSASRTQVKFDTPQTSSYQNITGSLLGAETTHDYAAFADVTSLVQEGGAGTYGVANVQANTGAGRHAGWALVVAYRDPSATAKNLTVFDGFATVNTTAPSTINIPISGFIAPPVGAVNAKIGAVAGEGDRSTVGDFLRLNGVTLSDAVNPADNFFNSSITNSGSNVTTKSPNFVNQTGFDADIVAVPTGAIANNATSATLTMGTTGDVYYPAVFTTAIEIYAPDVTAVKSAVDVNGGVLMPGDIIEYTIDVDNQGGDGAVSFVLNDPIPANTTYVAGSLEVVSGANAGAKSDALGDDHAEYISVTNSIRFRLGTGAVAAAGGALGIGESTVVRFRVQVDASTPGNTLITNQANLTFQTFSTNLSLSASTTAASMVVPVNAPPVHSIPGAQTVSEDTTLVFSSTNGNLISVADPDAGAESVQVTVSVTNGAISLSGTVGLTFSAGDGVSDSTMTFSGSIAQINSALAGMGFTPTSDYSGTALLTILTNDLGNSGIGGALTDSDSVSITVSAVNDAPSAIDDSFTTSEGIAAGINVKTNDSDAEGNTLTITQVNGTPIVAGGSAVSVTNGTVALSSNGTTLTFTSSGDYNGPASFSYTVSDGFGGATTATVSGMVSPVNDIPIANADVFGAIDEDSSASTTPKANDSDVDGDSLAITHVNGTTISPGGSAVAVTNGSVTLSGDGITLTFTPTSNYNGPVSYSYTISDGAGGSATTTVSGSVTAVNDAPTNLLPNGFSTNEDTSTALNGFSITDPDSENSVVSVTLTVSSGTLAAANSGGVSVTGSGSNSIVLTGTVTNLNLFLTATAPVYSPVSDFNGNVTLTMLTSDLGNSGTGGTLTDSDTSTITINAINDIPVAGNDSFGAISEDTSASTSVLTNDTDVEGDSLSVTHVNGSAIVPGGSAVAVSNGSVSLDAAGTQLTFTPVASYNGPVSYSYTISDGAGGTATATVSGSVTAVNDVPIAANDSFTTPEDTAVAVVVMTNDSDVDGDLLTITHVNGIGISAGGSAVAVTNGSVALSGDGITLTFTPTSNYNGPVSYSYTISDGAGGTATATVSGSITAVNDVPVATGDSFATVEDTAVSVVVMTNDSDVEGNPLTITHIDGTAITAGGTAVAVTNGSVTLSNDGTTLTFAPALDYYGTVSFTYSIYDGAGAFAIATVSGSVVAVNDTPSPVIDTITTSENAGAAGNVLLNDVDVDLDSLFVNAVNGSIANVGESVSGSDGGMFTVQSNGTYAFDPGVAFDDLALGESRTTSVTYSVSDGRGGVAVAMVTVTVTGTNDFPISGTIATQNSADLQSVLLDVSGSFDDPDASDLLTFTANDLPSGLSIDPSSGVISGILSANASTDGPYNVVITAADPHGISTAIAFVWDVTNPAPTASVDIGSLLANASGSGTVLANDTDPDGDTLAVIEVNGIAENVGSTVTGSGGGTFTINADGSYIFNPGTVFDDLAVGETRTTFVTYKVTDGEGGSDTATVTMTITGTNDAPTSTVILARDSNEQDSINFDASTYFVDLDVSTVLSFSALNLPVGLTIDANTGVVSGTISSDASTFGPFSVTITGTDPSGASTSQTFVWTVMNPAPVSTSDASTISENSAAVGNVLVNDSDPDGDALTVSEVNGAAGLVGGNITGTGGGTFNVGPTGTYTFNPGTAFDNLAAGETRVTAVSYTALDGQGAVSIATLTVTVTGVNDAPDSIAISDQANSDGQAVLFDISDRFSDDDTSDLLTYSAINLPPGLSLNSETGVISGTINSNASVSGPYTVAITATDPHGVTASRSFSWNVANTTPAGNTDANAITQNGVASGNVLLNDVDADGDTLLVGAVHGDTDSVGTSVAGSGGGTFLINSDGSYSFNPGTDFNDLAIGETRTTSVSYSVTDGQGGTIITTLDIIVSGLNDSPTSIPLAPQSHNDGAIVALNISASFNDTDLTNVLTFSASNLPPGLSIHPSTGLISGTIHHSASVGGPYPVAVTVADTFGATTSQTFLWTVVNPSPVAATDAGAAFENDTMSGNVLANDADPDNDLLNVVEVNGVPGDVGTDTAGSSGGLFQLAANGAYSFNPGSDFDGLAQGETRTTSVTYTTTDAEGGVSSATLAIVVTGTNDGPVSSAMAERGSSDASAVSLNLHDWFSDADGTDALTFAASNLPPGLSLDANTGILTGTISSGASTGGPYAVTLTATDPHGASTTQSFVWIISNIAPIANPDLSETTENALVTGSVFSNDLDPDGDLLLVSAVDGMTDTVGVSTPGSNGGFFTINADGTYTFSPGSDFEDLATGETRSTSISYLVDDGNGDFSVAALTFLITGVNDAPVSTAIAMQSSNDGQLVAFNVSGNFSDPDASDLLVFTDSGTLPPGLSIDPITGIISGRINTDASVGGPYSVEIQATDPMGVTTSQTLTWNILNPTPTATQDVKTTTENTPVSGNVLLDGVPDSDPDGDSLSVNAVDGFLANVGRAAAGSAGGLFTVEGNGNYTFNQGNDFEDLSAGQSRTTTISYTIADADGATSTASIEVGVQGVNDAPVMLTSIPAQSSAGLESVLLDVSTHFLDADASDRLTFHAANLPPGLSLHPETGVISGIIDSDAAASGPFHVVITATDLHGGVVTTSLTWNVANPDLAVSVDDAVVMAEPGDTVIFTVNYQNTNNSPATGVVLTQTLPENTTFSSTASSAGWVDTGNRTYSINLGTVGGFVSGNVRFAVSVDPNVASGFEEITTASAIADDGNHGIDLTPSNNTDSEQTTISAEPNLRIMISEPANLPEPGESVSYNVAFDNSGNQEATGVVVRMTLPANATFNAATSTPGWVYEGDGIYAFYIGSVASLGSGSLVFALDLPSTLPAGANGLVVSGSIVDDGMNGPDRGSANNFTTSSIAINAQPDYSISIDDGRLQIYRGETTSYKIAVVNNGNQHGTGATVTSLFPKDVLENVTASHGGIVDLLSGTITWHLGHLAAGESVLLTVEATVSLQADDSIFAISISAIVSDDATNGADPTPANNAVSDTSELRPFNFDTFHNRSQDRFGMLPPGPPPLTTRLLPIPLDPIFSGITLPGSTLVGKIYDQHGNLIGERQVMADSSGNWMMSFPNSVVVENPHRMDIVQTASTYSGIGSGSSGLRRYFHPASHSSIFFTTELTPMEVTRRTAYQMMETVHEGNNNPYGFHWCSLSSELAMASSNAGEG